ncbi:MAG: ATP-binding protein [Bacteroidales bacterium]
MEKLQKYSDIRINYTPEAFSRYLYDDINWDDRLIGILGARGVGKTTLMLQNLKKRFGISDEAMYLSLDDFYFTRHRLFDTAEMFYQNGGRFLYVDEVHKYRGWSLELKNLYDIFPDLKIVFSGSSALELYKSKGDLSRRAALYHLHELSFREYLGLRFQKPMPVYTLDEIIHHHRKLAFQITDSLNKSILPLFNDYLTEGAYPFAFETGGRFYDRLSNTVNTIIENDLLAIEHLNYYTAYRLRKIITMVADSAPFKLNISELSRKADISRDVLLRLLNALKRANLLLALYKPGGPTGHLTKPEKLYINNTVLLNALSTNANKGTMRETFFANQVILKYKLHAAKQSDFLVNNRLTFEIGGRNKTQRQIQNTAQAYIAADDIESGSGKRIPLWMFGFLY